MAAQQRPLRELLETYMARGTERDVSVPPLSHSIDRLVREGEYLYRTSRHGWVRSRVSDLNDAMNWASYALEIHMTYELENAGYAVQNSAKCISNDNSDLDILYKADNGVDVLAECVSMHEPESLWQASVTVAPGVVFKEYSYGAQGEADLLRRLQHKLRVKTIRTDGRPIKFPPPRPDAVQFIIADVTKGPGFTPDRWDLEVLSWGNSRVHPVAARPLVGLFEPTNPYAPDMDSEFLANVYMRERLHAIMFLIDESHWKSPLDPTYKGVFLEHPSLPMNQDQMQALTFGTKLASLVREWWVEQYIVPGPATP